MSQPSPVPRSNAVNPSKALGRFIVLDLETHTDSLIRGLSTGSKSSEALVQEIRSCSALIASEPQIGTWEIENLATASHDEDDILRFIDQILADYPTVVTYNGRRHDLPIIRRRIMRFKHFGLENACNVHRLPHLDLYDFPPVAAGGHHGSLQDRCAALGADARTYIEADEDTLPRAVLKGETDVIATFVLLLHELAAWRANGSVWTQGVRALQRAKGGELARRGHLKRLISGPMAI
jgi:hypothetical protein